MKSFLKKLVIVLVVFIMFGLGYGVYYSRQAGPIGTGYTAKVLCSSVFISGRDKESIMSEDLALTRKNFISGQINKEDKSVTASMMGFFKRKAVYREGIGCTLVIDTPVKALQNQVTENLSNLSSNLKDQPWPTGDKGINLPLPDGINANKLTSAMNQAFLETDPNKPIHTRAVVVVYNGNIIAEKYASGFNKDTPLIGWSMTKSIINALVGILVKQDKLSIKAPAPIPQWQQPEDPRKAITIDQLLRMSSGLEFQEEYESTPRSDCNVMLFDSRDAAALAVSKPLETAPDSKWSYSSGTTNIISKIIRDTVGGTDVDYFAFPRQALFNKIGMRSAILEPDSSGTFIGSSYMYATARDWARFGLLYYNDGIWNGEHILPEGWVKYTRTPTPKAPPESPYGAQFWLNTGSKVRWMPDLPTDTFSALGHHGQAVTIIPSKKLVVVRLGLSDGYDCSEVLGFVKTILEALPADLN